MLVLCSLAMMAVREISNYWIQHWLSGRLSQLDQQLDICKSARELPNELMRGLCHATVFKFVRQLNLHNSIGDVAKLSAAAIVTVTLYLWASARMVSRLIAPSGRMAAVRRETVYACIAAAILLAPILFFYIVKIAHGLFDDLRSIGLSYSNRHAILRASLSAIWFLIAAPFVLPAVPLALISSRSSSLVEATHLGWNRYMEFAALAAATAGLFIGLAALTNWFARVPVISFLASSLDLGSHVSRALFDALLTTLALLAVVAIAAAFTVAVGSRTEAR